MILSNDENENLRNLKRYQVMLLASSGVALMLLILSLLAFATHAAFKNYQEEIRQSFITHRTLIMLEVQLREAAMRRITAYAELIWHDQHISSPKLLNQLAKNLGRMPVYLPGKLSKQYVVADLESNPKQYFASYLGFSIRQIFEYDLTYTSELQRGQRYFYTPKKDFLAIYPAPNPLQKAWLTTPPKDIIKHFAIPEDDFKQCGIAYWPSLRKVCWLYAHNEFTKNEPAVLLVKTVFSHAEPFAIFVNVVPIKAILDRNKFGNYAGSFTLINDNGIVLYQQEDTKNNLKLNWVTMTQQTAKHQEFYKDGHFIIVDPLTDNGLILVYQYSWHNIWHALWLPITLFITAALFGLGALWVLLTFYFLHIVKPFFGNSQRIFDSEKLNRTIIETTPIGLALLSIATNQAILKNDTLLGYESSLSTDEKSLCDQVLNHYSHLNRSDLLLGNKQCYEYELFSTRLDKTCLDFHVGIVRSRYAGEDVLLCSFVNITALKEIERQARKAQRAAQIADQAKSVFVTTISHEIRTPLNAILGNLELLARELNTVQHADRIASISVASESLVAMIDQLLDFSKIESGQMEINLAPLDLIEIVEQAIVLYVPLCAAKNIFLYYKIDINLKPSLIGDAFRIRQIFVNLLSNAVKFTKTGKISICVVASQVQEKDSHTIQNIKFIIQDSGIGIASSKLEAVFQSFVQADASTTKHYGGSGIGLALCQQLCELMNGSINLQSTLGKGSRFTVNLPLLVNQHLSLKSEQNENNLSGKINQKRAFATITLTLLSNDSEWLNAIEPQLHHWGLAFHKIEHPKEIVLKNGILLIFEQNKRWHESDEISLVEQTNYVIYVVANGPRLPLQKDKYFTISCYSLAGIRDAIRQAGILNGASLAKQILPAMEQLGSILQLPSIPSRVNSIDKSKIKILVAEDDPVNRTLLADQLNVLGYNCDLAADGVEAVKLAINYSYSAIFTDLNMREMDGLALALCLRDQKINIPIVALTADVTIDMQNRCQAAGINKIVVKPISLATLQTIIHQTLSISPQPFQQNNIEANNENFSITEDVRNALLASSREHRDALFEAIKNKNKLITLTYLHTMKGAFAAVRIQEMVQLCRNLEALCEQEDWANIFSKWKFFDERLDHHLNSLAATRIDSHPNLNV